MGPTMRPWAPSEGLKSFLTRHTVKIGISNLYILLKCALKMREMPFQRPKMQKFPGEHAPDPATFWPDWLHDRARCLINS